MKIHEKIQIKRRTYWIVNAHKIEENCFLNDYRKLASHDPKHRRFGSQSIAYTCSVSMFFSSSLVCEKASNVMRNCSATHQERYYTSVFKISLVAVCSFRRGWNVFIWSTFPDNVFLFTELCSMIFQPFVVLCMYTLLHNFMHLQKLTKTYLILKSSLNACLQTETTSRVWTAISETGLFISETLWELSFRGWNRALL